MSPRSEKDLLTRIDAVLDGYDGRQQSSEKALAVTEPRWYPPGPMGPPGAIVCVAIRAVSEGTPGEAKT